MKRMRDMPMASQLLVLMFIFNCVIRIYAKVPLLTYAFLQCILVGLFVLLVSVYGAFKIRRCEEENKAYMERIGYYDTLESNLEEARTSI